MFWLWASGYFCSKTFYTMKFFYLSSLPNAEGLFEIHDKECELIPESINRDYLGPFNNGKEALRVASQKNPKAALCAKCCSGISQAIIFSSKNKESSQEI
ncbi:hypothetical protein DFQ04_1309 [Algoriphagus boseongensis]|uniref:Uncharacterized protein n=2 Tax=Algoriphagus boseongensis TaxID=1442587 RepID=A0A4V3D2M7_9BACT|nr:hypothetical protein DFQ04_1309 [Algoriphagus boseongensis]